MCPGDIVGCELVGDRAHAHPALVHAADTPSHRLGQLPRPAELHALRSFGGKALSVSRGEWRRDRPLEVSV
jgi:hypothetical protein